MPALYDASNNDETRLGRLLATATHMVLPGLAIYAAAKVATYCGVEHWLLGIVNTSGFVLVLLGIVHSSSTRLCVRCMGEVPANVTHRAEQQRWVLWIYHSVRTWRRILITLIVYISVDVLVTTFQLPTIARLPVNVHLAVYLYSIWLHHKLRPWCPYCRNWDDGEEIVEPSPDPAVKATL